jgi:uncharacterized protein (DUF433 family)
MTKRAFDKIADGLEEVMAIVCGEATPARANLLCEAEAIVEGLPDVLRGEPCLKRTRLPVRMVGAIAVAHGVKEARATYPHLSRRQVELAVVYTMAHPKKRRPKKIVFATKVTRQTVT